MSLQFVAYASMKVEYAEQYADMPFMCTGVADIAQELLAERLPAGSNILIDPQAFIDTPIDHGRHWQRCFLVPKSSSAIEAHSDDSFESVLQPTSYHA